MDVNPAADTSLLETPAPLIRPEHAEGNLARLIEQQSAKVPSHWFLFAALSSMVVSFGLEVAGRTRESRFVGMWPTPLLVAGMYNKLEKTLGTR
jgi:hypothetical protein